VQVFGVQAQFFEQVVDAGDALLCIIWKNVANSENLSSTRVGRHGSGTILRPFERPQPC